MFVVGVHQIIKLYPTFVLKMNPKLSLYKQNGMTKSIDI